MRRVSGFTLVELVISITIIAIAVSAVLGVMTLLSRSSADALVRQQAAAIGAAYLEEALLKSYDDPDAADGESARTALDDVDDYDGLHNVGARDQFDSALSGLEQYTVDVAVTNDSLGPAGAAVNAFRVDVSVTHPAGVTMLFSGYRTRY